MITMTLKLEPDEPVFPVAEGETVHFASELEPLEVATLADGMESGRPSVAMRCRLDDGSTVIIQTSARLFVSIARGIAAKYPDLFDGP